MKEDFFSSLEILFQLKSDLNQWTVHIFPVRQSKVALLFWCWVSMPVFMFGIKTLLDSKKYCGFSIPAPSFRLSCSNYHYDSIFNKAYN